MVRLIVVLMFCSSTYASAGEIPGETQPEGADVASANEYLNVDEHLKRYEEKLQRIENRNDRSRQLPSGKLEEVQVFNVDEHLKRYEEKLQCTIKRRNDLPQLCLLNGITFEQANLMDLVLRLRESSTKLVLEKIRLNQYRLNRGPSPSQEDVRYESKWKRRIDALESATNRLRRQHTLAYCSAVKMMQL